MFSKKHSKHIVAHHQHEFKEHVNHLKNVEKQKIQHDIRGAAGHSAQGMSRRRGGFSIWKFLFWLIVLGVLFYWINSLNCTSWHVWKLFC